MQNSILHLIYFILIKNQAASKGSFFNASVYQFNFFTVSVALTPFPSVMPTASSAERAISITSPAVRFIMVLPLYNDPTPTESTLEMAVDGIIVPLLRTASVTAVPNAAESVEE